jgi:4-amino-4-deoxy-L-arabinose transferase-like glycosyltransferase
LWSRLGPLPAGLANRLPAGLSVKTLAVPAAVVLTALATVLSQAFQQFDQTNYAPVLILWFGAGLAYLAAFAPALPTVRRAEVRAWLRANWRELVLVGLIIALGAYLRFDRLGRVPRIINGDEGLLGQAALSTDLNPLANPFALFENFGAFYLQIIAIFLRFFGHDGFGLRLAPAIGGTLAIGALYLLARWLFGRRVAVFAALLLAISHAHLHFSRTVAVGYIQSTLLIPLELYFFISGLEKRSAARMALGGLLLGLNFSVYISAEIVVAFLLVYLVIAAIVCRPLIQQAYKQVAVFWGGVLVAALPELVYAWSKPEQFMERLNADGTFQSGWLAEQVANTGRSPVLILLERVTHAFLSINYYPSTDFYGAVIPLVDVLTSVLFLVGLVYAFWRWRNQRYLLLNGYFWAVTLAVGLFAVPPSADSYRMLIGLPGIILLAAVGLEQVLTVLTLADAPRRLPRVAFSLALIASILLLNWRAYWVDFITQCRYGGDQQTRFASYLGRYLAELDRDAQVYLLSNDILLYGTHSSVDFLSDGLPVTNVPESADSIPADPNTAVIAIGERAEELVAWAHAHPGGNLERQYDCDNLMLVAYVLPERAAQ